MSDIALPKSRVKSCRQSNPKGFNIHKLCEIGRNSCALYECESKWSCGCKPAKISSLRLITRDALLMPPLEMWKMSIISSISWILTTWSEHCSKSCCPRAPIYPNWEKTLWPQACLWKLVHTKMVNESLHRTQNAFNHPWLSNVAIARVSVMYSGGHSNQATNQAVLTWEAGPIPAGPVSQSWILA
jgi:hypothetical protein